MSESTVTRTGTTVTYDPRTGRQVEHRYCGYCWTPFTPKRSSQHHCSPVCSKRDSAWDRWIRETNYAATHGTPDSRNLGPALPAGGASLFDAVDMFATSEEAVA